MPVKDAKRLARDIARTYGGRVHMREKKGTSYIFEDGYVWFIGERDSFGAIAGKAAMLRDRYGRRETDHFHWADSSRPKPTIDLERLRASEHAKERLALMQEQAKVEYREVLHAIRLPERVVYSEQHNSWLWIRDRIAVAVAEEGDTFVITTVLWTSKDLFEQYPRPA